MAKVVLNDVTSLLGNPTSAQTTLNANMAAIEAAFENTLSRDGSTPNQMEADIDMNMNSLLNVADPVAELDGVNLRSVRPLVLQFAAEIAETIVFASQRDEVFTATALQTQFLLEESPENLNNTLVFLDGVYQSPGTDYTLSGGGLDVIEFFSGVPLGVEVSVRYSLALPTGITDAASIIYTPPSTGVLGTIKSFLDSLWTAGAATGGALIRYIQAGANAVAYDLQAKSRERVNVFDYMTFAEKVQVQLGLGDMTAAIQAAAAGCITLGHDSHLHFHKGIYNVSAETLIQFSGVVSGAGTADTHLRPTVNNINVFSTEDGFGQVVFRDMNFIPTVTMVGGAGITLNTPNPSDPSQQLARIQNCRFQNLWRGFEAQNNSYWVVDSCSFFDCILSSIYGDCTSNFDAGDNTIVNCLITSGATGDGIRLANNCRIVNNKILGHVRGIYIEPTSAPGTRVDYHIVGNSIENQSTHGLLIRVTDPATGVANSIIGQNQFGMFADGAQCIAINGPVGGLSINNNVCVLTNVNQVGIATVGNGAGSPGTIIINHNQINGSGTAGTTGIFHGGSNTIIEGNMVGGVTTEYNITSAGATIRGTPFTFATLPALAANGSLVYVSDGAAAYGGAVTGGGTGCFAGRLNGAWVGT